MISQPLRNVALAASIKSDPYVTTQHSLQELSDLIASGIESTYAEISELPSKIRRNIGIVHTDFGILIISVDCVCNFITFSIYIAEGEAPAPEDLVDIQLVGVYGLTLEPEPNAC